MGISLSRAFFGGGGSILAGGVCETLAVAEAMLGLGLNLSRAVSGHGRTGGAPKVRPGAADMILSLTYIHICVTSCFLLCDLLDTYMQGCMHAAQEQAQTDSQASARNAAGLKCLRPFNGWTDMLFNS